MFGLHPSAPTHPDDYTVHHAGRPLRNTRVWPRGLTPRRLAQLAGADPRGVRHATPDPWVPEPALVLSDVVAGQEPWMGMLLDPARPQPVPIGSLVRSAAPRPARHWLVWPDARLRPARGLAGTDPRSVAAYLDESAIAHFAGGEVGTDIAAVWPHRLLDPRRPAGPAGVSALNMATVYGLRTDGCGAVACLADLTVLDCPGEAARTRARVAAERNLPPTGVDVLDVAGRILGLDPATRDALFCGAGSRWVDDLGAIPKQAVLAALDRVIAGRRGAAIWSDTSPTGRRPEARPAVRAPANR